MDDLIDILDSDGRATGKTAMKSEAHQKGWFHPTAHIWFYTRDGKIRIQQRGKKKNTHPLLWDVSVAGHIGAGEKNEYSAVWEIEEEIGLKITENDLQEIGLFKAVQKHSKGLIDCGFHYTFLCELKVSLKNLVKQDSEVKDLALIGHQQFTEETSGMKGFEKYVPHDVSYYMTISNGIKKRLALF